jgi:hypothetical protein
MSDERPLAGLPLRSVPETRPTRLPRDWFVYLSVIAFVAGAVAITALDLGAPVGSPIVRLCVLVGTPALVVALADATVRIWRSAWAWMPVDRAKGVFRLAWLVVPVLGLAATVAAVSAVLVG